MTLLLSKNEVGPLRCLRDMLDRIGGILCQYNCEPLLDFLKNEISDRQRYYPGDLQSDWLVVVRDYVLNTSQID